MRKSLLVILIAAGVAAGAPAHGQRMAGARPDISTDEGGLWDLSDRAEQAAKRSAELNRDVALNAYVREVACKVAKAHCGDIRVYVMDRPFFNASMSPNGYSEIWSGVLLRTLDES